MKKKLPKFKSDRELEKLLEGDLSDYINKENFKKTTFEFLPKDEKVNIRFSSALLKAVKKNAGELSMSYQKYIRHVLEKEVL